MQFLAILINSAFIRDQSFLNNYSIMVFNLYLGHSAGNTLKRGV